MELVATILGNKDLVCPALGSSVVLSIHLLLIIEVKEKKTNKT